MHFLARLLVSTLLLTVAVSGISAPEEPLLALASNMQGTFSSAEQARGDQNFQNATLTIVRFWPDRTDGVWLYAEQALTGALRHPYKQTVYHLTAREDGSIECQFFDLLDPIAATGAWKDTTVINNFTPADLRARENCLVVLRAQPDGSFRGITDGKGCTNIQGAAYATTEMTISSQQITLWERGFHTTGKQIWGSVHGGYLFKKSE
jgi:hypothetical protein